MLIYFTGFVFILPFKGKLYLNYKTTSCIKNKNGKRKGKKSFLRTAKNDATDDFYCE